MNDGHPTGDREPPNDDEMWGASPNERFSATAALLAATFRSLQSCLSRRNTARSAVQRRYPGNPGYDWGVQ